MPKMMRDYEKVANLGVEERKNLEAQFLDQKSFSAMGQGSLNLPEWVVFEIAYSSDTILIPKTSTEIINAKRLKKYKGNACSFYDMMISRSIRK